MLDATQLVNGVAVLISFYVGYKYGLKQIAKEPEKEKTSEKTEDSFKSFFRSDGDYKMIMVVRNDLKMGKGKIAAQCGHAAVGAFERALKLTPRLVRLWEQSGCAKIAVKVESEADLMAIQRRANSMSLNTCLVRDAGRTQIQPNTKTVLAIGPDTNEKINQITGHLKLL